MAFYTIHNHVWLNWVILIPNAVLAFCFTIHYSQQSASVKHTNGCCNNVQYSDTHHGVFNLGVHEESSVLVGDQGPVLAGEDVRKVLQVPAPSLARREVGHQGLAHGVDDRRAAPAATPDRLLQLLKLIVIIAGVFSMSVGVLHFSFWNWLISVITIAGVFSMSVSVSHFCFWNWLS